MKFDVKITGSKELKAGFARAAKDCHDLRPAYLEVYRDFLLTESAIFRKQGSPQKWVALSPAYAKWKRRHYPGKKMLELTGNYRASLTTETHKYALARIEPQRALFGSTDPVHHLHALGTKRKIPARPAIQVTAATKKRWTQIIGDYVLSRLEADLQIAGKSPIRLAGPKKKKAA